ncbi:MAG: hypothetical protein U0234_07655 [Sandaracinus sp.]
MSRSRIALLALPLLVVPACASRTPTLADSVGTVVEWSCMTGECQVTASSEPPPECEGDDIFVVGAGALAILCGASIDATHTLVLREASCRPLVCNVAADCPHWPDRDYGCDGGICTTSEVALDALDIEALCLLHAARAATCEATDADPAVAMALAQAQAACTATGCAIPEACRP